MSDVVLTLSIPPSANRYWRTTGRVYVSSEAQAYKREVGYITRCEKIAGPVAVNVTIFRPRRVGDLDNYLKVMLDALKGILYDDDNQIVEIHAYRDDDPKNPRVEFLAYPVK